jgi:uncharacterized tellurite resistance protein B-like protein
VTPGETSLDDQLRQQLLQELEDYFTKSPGIAPDPSQGDRQLRIATAALLLELGRADGEARHDEHRAIARTLERVLGATPEQAAAVLRLAEDELAGQRPLRSFTRAIDRSFTRDEKRRLVEGLWRVAFADAELLAHEEYLIRKIAEQIHLPFEDFLRAKIEAKEACFGLGPRADD